MTEFTCIVCPNGCTLHCEEHDGKLSVSGNKCKRGEDFAIEEQTAPMRTVCTTVRTSCPDMPVLPVRTAREIPKARMFDVMRALDAIVVGSRVHRGDCIVADVLGLGVDVIATADMPQ